MTKITGANKEAEDIFLKVVSRSLKASRESKGPKHDIRITMDNDAVFTIDVRMSTTGILNQVRAIRYVPMAVYNPEEEYSYRWTVIPPHLLVVEAASKRRGQHNEIPFECCSLNIRGFGACGEDELEYRVVQAIKLGEEQPLIKRSMHDLEAELRKLNYVSKKEVKNLALGKIPPYWR